MEAHMAKRTLPEQGYLRECFDYNPNTGELTWKERPLSHFLGEWRRWNKRYAGKPAGSLHKYGIRWDGRHRIVILDRKNFGAHRLVWKLITGSDPVDEVDHVNRRGDDNRWSNLREATRREQMQNTRGRRRKHHQLPIGAHPNGKKFVARINAGGNLIYLGQYDTAEKASAAYLAAKKELHPFDGDHQL
jgi:hypothetical protein